MDKVRERKRLLSISLLLIPLAVACGGKVSAPPDAPPERREGGLARTAFTIQAGAFANVENAARFADLLTRRGLGAYYFAGGEGFYKVRFGNFPTKEAARVEAARLQAEGLIEVYYIVGPEEHAASREGERGSGYVREEIVKTAESYIGLPYRWGGTSPQEGFDCSGLTMTVYRLNGLELPRSSREQYRAGRSVEKGRLLKGDLVFFATSGGSRVSHVGIYIGDDRFIHAPGRGETIRTASLTSDYFKTRFLGGRTYL